MQNKSNLKAQLCGYVEWLFATVEPVQSIVAGFANRYKAGMSVGDIYHAMISRFSQYAASFHVGENLVTVSKNCALFIQQAVSTLPFNCQIH